MSGDILSDVLRSVRLRGAVFYYLNCGEEWAAEAPAAHEFADVVMPGADHVMEYHVITKGTGWAAVRGERPVRLAAGDIVLFPHGDAHVLSSAPDLPGLPRPRGWMIETRDVPKPMPVNFHSATECTFGAPAPQLSTNVACGFLGCDLRPFNPLIAGLPRLLHLPASDEAAWIAQLMQQAVAASQSRRPGSGVVLERLSEMMFVDAIRRYAESLPEGAAGWLAGLRDRHVGRALALMHRDAARDWTVDALASEVALSRSALYDRFVQLVGQPPMQYLTHWRMQMAANLLRDGRASVAAIALDVGYESEAAFSRAFKRATGTPPAAWRRQRQSQSALGA